MIRNSFYQILSIFLIAFSIIHSQVQTVHGIIVDEQTHKPIEGVNVYQNKHGSITDLNGEFFLEFTIGSELTFSHIGYETIQLIVNSAEIEVSLTPRVIPSAEIFVNATRAVEGVTPVAFSVLTPEEIQARYTVEDVPMVLALEPGVYAYSESGNGTGYSYVSIRGFDQSRIAVMLNNVPLNDNESHQVYWVDHADILSDASDVQIQRGIGNSLYGSSAFGGSINVTTRLTSTKPNLKFKLGKGSFNTSKMSVKGESGPLANGKLHLLARYSQLQSDGYRDYHNSDQKALFFGGQYASGNWVNRFSALIGYENTNMAWWGVYGDDIDDRKKRRAGYQAYMDDFLQQIYSLNSIWQINADITFSNVTYLVKGAGYYENDKGKSFDLTAEDDSSDVENYGSFLWEYNLDHIFSSTDSSQSVSFTRRKWIVNSYYGIIPTFTLDRRTFRLDIGGELRFYTGDHYGRIKLDQVESITGTWQKYYQYNGSKRLITGFTHLMVKPIEKLRLVADLQVQSIHWTLDQKKIGHAAGHQLNADWRFVNPRFGAIYSLSKQVSLFVNYGRGQKEPADDQIIEADDVFYEPVMAAAEVIDDYEFGSNFHLGIIRGSVNLYRINYKNEQLKNIDTEQEGEYEYYSAEGTIHQGLEYELLTRLFTGVQLGINGSFSNNYFNNGSANKKYLPSTPAYLQNLWVQAQLPWNMAVYSSIRLVGKQFMPAKSYPVSEQTVSGYRIVDLGISWSFGAFEVNAKINNLFNDLYVTNGYDWDGWLYYWPGATRNVFVSFKATL